MSNTKLRFAKVAVADVKLCADRPYRYALPEALADTLRPGCRVIVPYGQGSRPREGFVLALCDDAPPEMKIKPVSAQLDAEPLLNQKAVALALWMRDGYYCTSYQALRPLLPAGLWLNTEQVVAVAAAIDDQTALSLVSPGTRAEALLRFLLACHGRRATLPQIEEAHPKATPYISQLKALGLIETNMDTRIRTAPKTRLRAELARPAEEAFEAVTAGRRNPVQRAVVALLAETGAAFVHELSYFTGATHATLRTLEKNGLVTIYEAEVERRAVAEEPPAGPVILTDEQQSVYDAVSARISTGTPQCALLRGVTGSGKTSVYLRLVHHTLTLGGAAIVAVPEIALTPQMTRQFAAHFGPRVAVLHSGLGMGERVDEWRRIRRGEVDVVVGTRSAVLAPLENLRLIILDEEHDPSYKSDNPPRYHAREVAKYRCTQHGATLLLGSATPSLEALYGAREGRYPLYTLLTRYNEKALPEVSVADMRAELAEGNATTVSTLLADELASNLARGEQSILFLNRRGRSRHLTCAACAWEPPCPNCSTSLTYHSANGRLMCHLCGYSERAAQLCPRCKGALKPLGAGTQQVEADLDALFPGLRTLRMDADTTGVSRGHEKLLAAFAKERVPVLIGTQMVTKGLDFENVTLVGVLGADLALFADDFRANERAFHLICQVVGRAGRGEKPGRAILQTTTPKHPLLLSAAAQDYEGFAESELAVRRAMRLPPYCDLARVTLFGADEEETAAAAHRLRGWMERERGTLELLGPAPARVFRQNKRYIFHITVRGVQSKELRTFLHTQLEDFQNDSRHKRISIYADGYPL